MEKVAKFAFGTTYLVISIIFSAYVLSVLWGWFIVPLGVSAIGIAHALGINVLVAFLKMKKKDTKKEKVDNYFGSVCESVTLAILAASFAFGFGWIATIFM